MTGSTPVDSTPADAAQRLGPRAPAGAARRRSNPNVPRPDPAKNTKGRPRPRPKPGPATHDTHDTPTPTSPTTAAEIDSNGEPGAGADPDPDPDTDSDDNASANRSDRPRRPWLAAYGSAAAIYLFLGFVLWWHAWSAGATTHTLCGCGDPALFLWFFQWPATALQHGQNPFYSSAMFHPHGINLLAQTSVTAISIPLAPVTWIWGPVASLNLASTLTPALTGLAAFAAMRRWAPWWPAAFIGGLLYGFSPFVIASLEFAHLMTAALDAAPAHPHRAGRDPRPPAAPGLGRRRRPRPPRSSSSSSSPPRCSPSPSSWRREHPVLVATALFIDPAEVRRRARHATTGLAVGAGVGLVLLAWPVWFALGVPLTCPVSSGPTSPPRCVRPLEHFDQPPSSEQRGRRVQRVRGPESGLRGLPRLGTARRALRRDWWRSSGISASGSSASC